MNIFCNNESGPGLQGIKNQVKKRRIRIRMQDSLLNRFEGVTVRRTDDQSNAENDYLSSL